MVERDTKGRFVKGNPPPKHKSDCQCVRCGGISYKKGRTYEEIYGKEKAILLKNKLSEVHKENPNRYWLGKKRPDNKYWLNKKRSDSTKLKISKNRKGKCTKDEHHAWQGGISFEPYGIEFNKELKNKIRERDNHQCQECGYTEKQLNYKLPVHHIDYDKKNNKPSNLISLCRNCHAQTNFNRNDWSNYFNDKIEAEVI